MAATTTPSKSPIQSASVKTILVVDDELGSAEILAMILTEEGYRASAAVNGAVALEMARQEVPDLMLVDYMMPIMNGAALIRAVKSDPALSGTKIVLNSGLSEESIRREFDVYDAFLRKPFRIELLIELIERMADKADPQSGPSGSS